MVINSNLIPRFFDSCFASSKEDFELNFDGNPKQATLSEPNASTAITATRALSIPPDKPMTTFWKLDFKT